MAWATRMSRNMRCEVMKHSAMVVNVCIVEKKGVAAETTKVGRTFATREAAGSSAFYE